MLNERDDCRHKLSPRPHTRESIFYNLHLADEGLSAFFYTWVDPEDRAGSLVTFYRDKGERVVFDHADGIPMAGQDFDDWQTGGLTIRHTKALEVAEISYAGDSVSAEMTFNGLHRAFPYSENAGGCPPWLADDRFEQSGAVQGHLVVDGRRIDFDTTAQRDHSWGTRDWGSVHHWKWLSGQVGPGLTFNALQTFAVGRLWTNGYVNRDGEVSEVTSVEVDFDVDADFGQTRVAMKIGSADGRALEAEVQRFALLPFAPGGGIVMHEAGCAGRSDGKDALVHVEMGWPETYVAHQVELRRQ